MSTEIAVKGLTLLEAKELREYLECSLVEISGMEREEIVYSIRTEYTTPTGLSSPIPPELVVVFVKGLVMGIGSGAGKLVFDQIRSWASRQQKTVTITLDGDEIGHSKSG